MQKFSDTQLIQKCQNCNDLKAFEELILRHQDKVRAVIYRFVKNTDELDDISQDTFIKAYKSINKFKGNSSLSTWLCRIAINTCKDKLKSNQKINQKIVSIEDNNISNIADKQISDTETYLSLSEDRKVIMKEIYRLPEAQKIAIILHDIEDYSYEEIAQISECPVGTVKSRLFNARKRVKEKLYPLMKTLNLN